MKSLSRLVLLGGLTLVAATAQAEQVVVYKQMPHMAMGNARLAVSPNGKFLRAARLGPEGQDGFRTRLPGQSTFWQASFLVDLNRGDTLTFAPMSDGMSIAPMEVVGKVNGFSARVEFTSTEDPVYTVQIKDAGNLVATWQCVPGGFCGPDDGPTPPPGGGGGGGVLIDVEPIPDPEIDEPTLFEETFKQNGAGERNNLAECQHAMLLTSTGSVSVAGVHLGDGDEIVVVERPRDAQPRYPYAGFDAMDVRTSAPRIVLLDEMSH